MNKSATIASYLVLFVLGLVTTIIYQSLTAVPPVIEEPRYDIRVAVQLSPEEVRTFTLKHSDCIPVVGLADYAKGTVIIDIIPSKDGTSFILVLDNGTILIMIHRADGVMVGKYFYLNNLPQD